jgi:peptide/nickel transport system permease protein
MAGYILRRGLEVVPTVLLVLTLVFLALRILPGDPAIAALGEYATPEAIATFRQKLGLDQPLWMQYLTFVGHALTGDFGVSMTNGTSINALLLDSLPYTIELALAATMLGIVIGVPLGAWAAVRRNRSPDVIGRLFALAGFSLPDFYVGVLLLIAFSLHLDWFPMLGGGEGFLDKLHHLVLPAITLGLVMAAFVMRLVPHVAAGVLRATSRARHVARHGERVGHLQHALPTL